MEERLQKIIARAGIASRRAAEQMIAQGRVRVDGKLVKELGTKADPETADIRVDGVRLRRHRPRRYLVLNKPTGYVTTRSDPGSRPTVMGLLPAPFRTLYPVGRLDMSSSGVLLLTDDGEFAQRVTHPRFGISKTYLVTVWGHPNERTLKRAQKGLQLDGERLQFRTVKSLGKPSSQAPVRPAQSKREKTRLRVVLMEGRNREIRRLFRSLGHPVVGLHREKVGPVSDRGLPLGAYRPLTETEILRISEAGTRLVKRLVSPAAQRGRRRNKSRSGPS
jgi:23S rRNA pseudouridine2605 synthase